MSSDEKLRPPIPGTIRGAVVTYLEVLGTARGDRRLEQVVELLGGVTGTERYDDAGSVDVYLAVATRGVDLLLRDGTLHTVFFSATDFPGWPDLIEQTSHARTRDDVVHALGEPLRERPHYVTYPIGPAYLQFDLEDYVVVRAVVMVELVGGL